MNKDLKDKTLEDLEKVVVGLGQKGAPHATPRVGEPKRYLAGYLFKFIHTQNGHDISALSTLSKAFRTQLVEQGYFISQLKVVEALTDRDGSAKYLFELADGERIESVLLPEEDRRTLCLSTQVGCPMGCAFCATGTIQFRRNLTAGEIVDQVNTVCSVPVRASEEISSVKSQVSSRHPALHTSHLTLPTSQETPHGVTTNRVTNIVYMGMGEPLLNYDAVLRSIRILNHSAGQNIGIRHITISTCGIVPAIGRLAGEDIRPRLAISLSAPTDALRSKLMPVTDRYPIAELLEAVRAYQARTGQRVTFEYVLIDRVNDSVTHARLLGGRALKFYSSVRIDLRRLETIKVGSEIVGSRVRAKVVKNKVAPPFKSAEFDIMFDTGISKEGSLLDLGVELGLVKKMSAFYSLNETRLGQGRENAKDYLRQHKDVAQELERQLLAKVSPAPTTPASDTDLAEK